ncbi:glutamate--tRNA ligase [Microbacterium sp. Root53]|uniref:glutamate--tRNA ligase n=1 Tax=Microbacterium sp. Root53 TaxID=1736553 RepID=UPI0006F7AEE6|nr:glutamate--tRNA ligase [Microbacterium sp. Root53]KQY98839.1 glutamate--tRNA ligase [Microbacterium sp. Root53]
MSSAPDPRTTTATGADVRVRFCPSPTGLPHVGLIRTALFNWAYARHHGGKLVFRIEDTDAARDSEESYQQLLDALRWLHIDWDEGVEVGGPHAPYRQSQRHDIYREVLDKLIASGAVYESFSTAEEIDARNEANGRAKQLGYDNFDRDLTEEQKAAFRAEGRQPALRLRVPDDEDLTFVDLIRGEITFPAGSFPDFVIVRPNGVPLYTFVNPVDDALMGITHVLRGEDLMPSTARQLVLYRALIDAGVTSFIPRFGHMPLVLGDGTKKLSKRDPRADLFLQREKGFIHEGLLNYLALLGWSIGPDRDVFSLDEFIAAFDIADVNPNPARFDQKKAESINGDHIRMLEPADFAERITPYLVKAGVVGETPTDAERELISKAAPLIQERLPLLGDAPGLLGFLFAEYVTYDEDARAGLPENAVEVLKACASALEEVPEEGFQTEAIQAALSAALIDGLGLKPRVAYGPPRVAISGRRVSPPLFESMELLGKAESIRRLVALVEELS